LRSRGLELGERTLIMGVLNVTPDSFSDGGKFFSAESAVEHGLRMLDEGADIIDIGGESTRPGMPLGAVAGEEELRRVRPVIEALRKARPAAVISIDTYKSEVARKAVALGAEIVNDVSGATWDAKMIATMADLGCGIVLMHSRGKPEEWRTLPRIGGDELLPLVGRELKEITSKAIKSGVERERIVIDPGFGFGKRYEENYPLLARLGELGQLGFPILAGVSRKSFVGRTVRGGKEEAPPGERLHGTLAAVTAAILQGAHIVRVHDVRPAVEAARVADAVMSVVQSQ
jgi:dihydropteroate synthase